MAKHDEPNEYGFAGEATAPEPAKPHDREEAAEEIAVPGTDLTTELSEALEDTREGREDHPDDGEPDANPPR